ncbi:MAG TPA: TonB-dependent receptor, partial [Blastocatellia bacterium]
FLRGAHQFKTGVDIKRVQNVDPFLPDVNGTYTFSSLAQVAANDPQTATVGEGITTLKFNETDVFAYFQDDWKIKDNLTLNLGVRYEFEGQPENVLNTITTARESNPATAFWLQSLPLSVRTDPTISTPDKNFAPRLGFAYTPRFWKGLFGDDKTVIRGGYSISYDPAFYNILVNVYETSPFTFLEPIVNPAPGSGGNAFGVPLNAFGPGVRSAAQAGGFIAFNKFDPAFTGEDTVAPHFRDPYAQQWSLGIQRQFGRNHVIELRYLGTHGVALFENQVLNPDVGQIANGFTSDGINFPGFPGLLPPGLHTLSAGVAPCVNNPDQGPDGALTCQGRPNAALFQEQRGNDAQSIYNSLQARYNGRITNSLTVGAAYTFSKALDDASEIFAFQEHSLSQDPYNITGEQRSYSGFDRPNQLSFNFIYDLPFYKNQEGLLGHVAGGWQLNGVYVLDSGLRYTPEEDLNDDLAPFQSYADPFIGDEFRPFNGNPKANPLTVGLTGIDVALLLGQPISSLHLQPFQIYSLNDLNTSGTIVPVGMQGVRFIADLPGAAKLFGTPFGDVTRNGFQGPMINQGNLGIFKNNRVSERVNVQLRLEIFNVLNHPSPGFGYVAAGLTPIPDRFIDDAGSTFNNVSDEEMTARAMQIGVRIIF